MRTADFDFELPPELIAQIPAPERDQSRLLILHRTSPRLEHRRFPDLLEHVRNGDVVVLNDSRVIPARLHGVNARSRGQFEILLLEENGPNDWWAMLRPAKRARVGTEILLLDLHGNDSGARAVVLDKNEEGHRRLRFTAATDILQRLPELGEVPLPPYIERADGRSQEQDRERYQTVFARAAGSVAAPTAGLHFTDSLLAQIRSRGARVCFVTLHVGPGTFAPVKTEALAAHTMHEERYEVSEQTSETIEAARRSGRRIIAVGTTTLRVLESVAAEHSGRVVTGAGRTRIFIHPPWDFKVATALLTNFHLPRSTLLMLVSAFAAPNELRGRDVILNAYQEAVRERYRFFSYGDAMLIV